MKGACFFVVLSLAGIVRACEEEFKLAYGPSKSVTYLTEPQVYKPGDVSNTYKFMEFPKGHIAIRGITAEMVDENLNSVPLSDLYLHHWVFFQRYVKANSSVESITSEMNARSRVSIRSAREIPSGAESSKFILGDESFCGAGQTVGFGYGSETRNTASSFEPPYGVEVGNPERVPEGSEEVWLANIHGIDVRGAVDSWGCLECKCDLYNQTIKDYIGGLYCCRDGYKCATKPGFQAAPRKYRLKYSVEYIDWNECVVPLKRILFDITDKHSITGNPDDGCKVEYNVPPCAAHTTVAECVQSLEQQYKVPFSGTPVFVVGHQHFGGIGITLYDKEEETICDSVPLYGRGTVAGDEKGYLVGMGSCNLPLDKFRVQKDDILTMRSSYNKLGGHTGVMGLLSVSYVADSDRESSVKQCPLLKPLLMAEAASLETQKRQAYIKIIIAAASVGGIVLIFSLVVVVAFALNPRGARYERLQSVGN